MVVLCGEYSWGVHDAGIKLIARMTEVFVVICFRQILMCKHIMLLVLVLDDLIRLCECPKGHSAKYPNGHSGTLEH